MNIEWLMSDRSGVPGFLLDLAVKSSSLLVVTLLVWAAIGRRRPAIGSAISHAGLIGLLLLPASSLLFPIRPIAILPPQPAVSGPVATIELDEISPPDEVTDIDPIPRGETIASPKLDLPASIAKPPTTEVNSNSNPKWTVSGPLVLAGLYVSISFLMLFRLVGSLVGVASLRRNVEPVGDPAWLDRLDRLVDEIGIRRPVRLARSSRVSVPVVVGWRRPMILLPASIDPIAHSDAILIHELAHVRRGDYGWNLILRVVEAIYWANPLAWMLAKVVCSSRERACDAFCVHRLGGISAYRDALIAMAEGLTRRPPSPALGLAMARSSRLASRVRAINRGVGESRCVPRWPTRLVILALALMATTILGPARLTPAQAPPYEPKKGVEPVKPAPSGKVFHLKVVGAKTGQPSRRRTFASG